MVRTKSTPKAMFTGFPLSKVSSSYNKSNVYYFRENGHSQGLDYTQERPHRNARTGTPAQERPHRNARTGTPAQERPHRNARTGTPVPDRNAGTSARTRQPWRQAPSPSKRAITHAAHIKRQKYS